MTSIHFSALKSAFLLGLSAFLVSAQPASCDRACLTGWMTRYLNAVVSHNPAAVPMAANVRFTEDSKDLKVGEGLWKTATKLGTYRQDFIDVRQQIAATHVLIEEGDKIAMTTVRLKVANGAISEIETLVTHSATDGRLYSLDGLKEKRPIAVLTPSASQRMSRDEMVKAAMFYPAGLIIGDFVKVDAPFASDAYRLENGGAMAGAGCGPRGLREHQDPDHHQASGPHLQPRRSG